MSHSVQNNRAIAEYFFLLHTNTPIECILFFLDRLNQLENLVGDHHLCIKSGMIAWLTKLIRPSYLSLDHCQMEGLLESTQSSSELLLMNNYIICEHLHQKETCSYHIVTKSLPVLSVQLLVEQRVEKLPPPQLGEHGRSTQCSQVEGQ